MTLTGINGNELTGDFEKKVTVIIRRKRLVAQRTIAIWVFSIRRNDMFVVIKSCGPVKWAKMRGPARFSRSEMIVGEFGGNERNKHSVLVA